MKNYNGPKIFFNYETIIGYGVFFLVTLCVVFLYRYIKLSAGALIDTLSYVFIPVLSWLFFKEKLKIFQIIGIIIIIFGIIVFVIFG